MKTLWKIRRKLMLTTLVLMVLTGLIAATIFALQVGSGSVREFIAWALPSTPMFAFIALFIAALFAGKLTSSDYGSGSSMDDDEGITFNSSTGLMMGSTGFDASGNASGSSSDD